MMNKNNSFHDYRSIKKRMAQSLYIHPLAHQIANVPAIAEQQVV